MTSLTVLFVLIGTAFAKPQFRIFNGTNALPQEFPYMVSVLFAGNHSCGGSLLSENYVLTAAHCYRGLENCSVVAGEHTHSVASGDEQRRKVVAFMRHESYNNDAGPFDIAVLKVDRPFVLNEAVQTIRLARGGGGASEQVGKVAVVSGWGMTGKTTGTADVLQKAFAPIQSGKICKKNFPQYDETGLCAGRLDGLSTVCIADSGGPLVVRAEDGSFEQIGIVSYGPTTCSDEIKQPDVYVRVSALRNWIESKLK